MATAAAAVIAKARRRIFDHLMGANAVSPEAAVDFKPGTAVQARQFERLRNGGVVKQTTKGQYWLDVPAYRDWANRRRRRLAAALFLVAIAVALSVTVTAGLGVIAR